MKQCVSLGKTAMLNGNPPVGSVIVKDGKVIGIGVESGKSSKDVTRHAEIEAVKDALKSTESLESCTLYTTHEPCIMCSYVLRHHKIKTVVYGTDVDYIGGKTSELKVILTTNVPKWGEAPTIIGNVLKEEFDLLTETYQKK
jgi:tRNA(adenine34) deaminase